MLVTLIGIFAVDFIFAQQEWQQFTSKEHGFQIRYPENWTEDPVREGVILSLSGPKTQGPSGKPMQLWIVLPSFVSPGMGLDAWSRILEGVTASIHRNQNFRILGRSYVALDSHQGVIITFNFDESSSERTVELMMLVIDGTRGFIISASSDERSPRRVEEVAELERILKSFRILRQ